MEFFNTFSKRKYDACRFSEKGTFHTRLSYQPVYHFETIGTECSAYFLTRQIFRDNASCFHFRKTIARRDVLFTSLYLCVVRAARLKCVGGGACLSLLRGIISRNAVATGAYERVRSSRERITTSLPIWHSRHISLQYLPGGGELIFASRAFHVYFSYDRTRINTRVHTHTRTYAYLASILATSLKPTGRIVRLFYNLEFPPAMTGVRIKLCLGGRRRAVFFFSTLFTRGETRAGSCRSMCYSPSRRDGDEICMILRYVLRLVLHWISRDLFTKWHGSVEATRNVRASNKKKGVIYRFRLLIARAGFARFLLAWNTSREYDIKLYVFVNLTRAW